MKPFLQFLVLGLLALPFIVFIGVGAYEVARAGHVLWLPAIPIICWTLAYLLFRQLGNRPILALPTTKPEPHWTTRDHDAWKIVEHAGEEFIKTPAKDLLRMETYVDFAQLLAKQLGSHYRPSAGDPLYDVTILEVLGVGQLVLGDLRQKLEESVPGSHFLAIGHWRTLSKTPGWYDTGMRAYWAINSVINPFSTVPRFFASRMLLTPITQAIQQNILAWFAVAFVHRLGFYLIELFSGRIRAGGSKYLAELSRMQGHFPIGFDSSPEKTEIAISLIGQVKAGKSSLINALKGERTARVDILPMTPGVERHQLNVAGQSDDSVILLDTPGYGGSGPDPQAWKLIEPALEQADIIVLVMDGRTGARSADLNGAEQIKRYFVNRPMRNPPPILGVVTHVDLLPPPREWSPPYDWQNPSRPKEHSIAEMVRYTEEALPSVFDAIIPVCTAAGKEFGVREEVYPALVALLGDARGAALVKALEPPTSGDDVRKLVGQLTKIGGHLLRAMTQGAPSPVEK